MEFTTKLITKKEVAQDTMSFYFEKPAEFTYKAGQYVSITLPHPSETDTEGNIRQFSLASAPHEQKLMITTRLRDTAFKRVLRTAVLSYEVVMRGPLGGFTLHEDTAVPAVFLVGGIGITPFRSMLVDITERKIPYKITLFYSNHNKQDAAFFDELSQLSQQNRQITFVPVLTRDETWNGEKGHIDKTMLLKYISDISLPIYYSAGPPQMVQTMKQLLTDLAISPDKIRTENFSGY